MRPIILFAISGLVGFIVDVGVLLMVRDAIGPFYGRAVSFLCAVLTTWLLNRYLTFRGRRSALSVRRELAMYLLLMAGGGVVNYATYTVLILCSVFVRDNLALGVAAGSVSGMVLNYITSRYLVFRHRSD